MPYRRLPKTDVARIKALKTLLEKEDAFSSATRVVEWKTLSEAQAVYDKFIAAYRYYKVCRSNQIKHSDDGDDKAKRARMFISHFIQVLNLSMIRGEIKESHKKCYGLTEGDYAVPDLSSEPLLLKWGSRIIKGEKERLTQGGTPIYNPTIAKVAVHYDLFLECYNRQKNLQKVTADSLSVVVKLRADVDGVLLDVWNQVEAAYQELPLLERYQKCKAYGLIYYYRRHESRIEGIDL